MYILWNLPRRLISLYIKFISSKYIFFQVYLLSILAKIRGRNVIKTSKIVHRF